MALVVGELLAKLKVDSAEYDKALKDAGDKLVQTGNKIKDVGESLSKKVTAPVVGLGTAIVTTFANFEQSMSNVKALTGATGQEFEQLKQLAKELGASTQFSAKQAADAMGFLAQAGFSVDQIMAALPGTLDLAAAGQLDLAEAADIATNILTGYALKVEDLARVNDVLAKAAAASNVDIQALGYSFKYAGPIAASAGIQFEEAAAAIALMGNAGIKGEQAGTTLRGAIARLLDPTKEMTETFAALGVQIYDSNGKLLPLIDIFKQLEEAGATTTDIIKIFGVEAGPGMQAILAQGTEALQNMINELQNSQGAAAEMAAIMRENLKGTWDEFTSAVEGAAIQLGEIMAPAINAVLIGLTNLVNAFTSLDPAVQAAIAVIAGIAAAIGPLILIVGQLTVAWGKLTAAIAAVPNPVMIAIGVLAALTAAIVTLWNTNEDFRNSVIQIWESIKEAGERIWNTLLDYTVQIWEGIQSVIQGVVEALNLLWAEWGDNITALFTALWDGIGNLFYWAWREICTVVENALNILRGIMEVFIGILTGDWDRAWEGIKTIFRSAVDIITNTWTNLWGILETVLDTSGQIIGEIIDGIMQAIVNTIEGFFGTMYDLGKDLIMGFFDGISSMFDWISDEVSKFVSRMTDKVKSVLRISSPSKVYMEIGRYMGEGMVKGLESTARAVDRAAMEILPDVNVPTPAMAGAAGAAGISITLNVYGSVGVDDIAEQLVRAIRRKQGIRF